MKKFAISSMLMFTILGIALIAYGSVCSIRFEQNCKGHLKHAADSNTVALAQKELAIAVGYLEEQGLTEGSTHVLYPMPSSDIGFWYTNLKASLDELKDLPDDADQLTTSNHLLKLRETIMDSGEKGTRVTRPPGIHVFPNQVACHALGWAAFLGLAVSGTCLAVACDKEAKAKCRAEAESKPDESV